MGDKKQAGVTLIELMIVVIIIGILTSIAVFMFSKQSARAKATEVNLVFTEIANKQEEFFTENGMYVNGEIDLPSVPGDTPQTPTPEDGLERLRLNFEKPALYCSYSVRSSVAFITANLSAIGIPFEAGTPLRDTMPEPATGVPNTTLRYMIFAICNFDGDSEVSFYVKASWADQVMSVNPGE